MKLLLYLIWIIAIVAGSALGEAASADSKYIVGFIFGCISMTILDIIHFIDKNNEDS